jgi:hypothetical protein
MARILMPDGSPAKRSKRKVEEGGSVNPHPGLQLTPVVGWLKDEIDTHERLFDKFLRRGRKILKKYRDVRSPREDAITRYNILWANVQTRLPALYARNPKPIVERRYKDRDPIGRTAAEILERSIEYTLDHVNDFFYVMRLAVQDYELPGMATVWVRYEPHFHKPELPAAEDEGAPEGEQNETTETEGEDVTSDQPDEVDEEKLKYEETIIDYVSWEDSGWSWARTWQEVRLLWKRAYMDRDELRDRFTDLTEEEIKQIPLDWSPKNLTDTQIRITRKKAVVYEVHDKKERKRYWVVKNFHKLLDERGDEMGLQHFFPTPRPLMANTLSDELLPTPNFTFYQDQANEIDELSTRIVAISKALKVAGVRDASAEGLDRLLSEGVENQLVPVSGWAAMKDKGGLAGSFELIPLEMIAKTLSDLREQRASLIEDVYQLTGIADIVRGFSDPNETATAQEMKGNFSILRIQDAQMEVQRFARDVIRIVGEIVAGYDIETLKQISGVKLLTNGEKQQLQLQIQMQQAAAQAQQAPHPVQGGGNPVPGAAPGQPPGVGGGGPPPAPPQGGQAAPGMMHPQAAPNMGATAPGQAPPSPEKLALLELPTWEEVENLLQNPVHREFRLDIETDSTIRMDDDAEKASRVELVTAVGGFLDKAVMAGSTAPEIIPMLGELMMFAIRSFKSARPIEQAFEDAMDALQKAASQPKGPPPEVQKAQMEAQTEIQVASMKAKLDAQVEQAKQQAQSQQAAQQNQIEEARAQSDAQLTARLEEHKAQLKAASDQQIQEMKNQFEAQRVQYETQAKIHIAMMDAHTKLAEKRMDLDHQAGEHEKDLKHEAGEKDRDRDHATKEGERQRKHEKEMPKPKAA